MASESEIEGDVFDRQRCVDGWRQELLETKTALLLGVGGLGCGIAMTLARLGIGKLILLDMDVVDATNLNRQLLFSLDSVGKRKVDAAVEGLAAHVIGKHTQVEAVHVNAVERWDLVVELAKKSDVIFNNIDVGGYFDFAVISLAKSLGQRPVSAGSSYARTWVVEYFANTDEHRSSFSYANAGDDAQLKAKLAPDAIQKHKSIEFIVADDNPPTRTIGSSALVCLPAAVMTVNAWVQSLFGAEMPNYTKFDVVSYAEPNDTLCWPHSLFQEE
jgi:ThiF family